MRGRCRTGGSAGVYMPMPSGLRLPAEAVPEVVGTSITALATMAKKVETRMIGLLMPAGPASYGAPPGYGTPAEARVKLPPEPRSPVPGVTIAALLIVVGFLTLVSNLTAWHVTATGFFGSATAEDVSLMRGVVGDQAGVKASGGIRTAANANAMINAGANRIGASASVAIVRELGAPEFTPKVKT